MDLLQAHLGRERGCDPVFLSKKRKKMAADLFDFFRGSSDIFYGIWSQRYRKRTPSAWICGDAHWENVGSYKGKNHVAYFDFTDFDDACLSPLAFDLGRAATSLYLLGQGSLAQLFLAAYREDLVEGKPYHIEAEVASGIIAKLLDRVKSRSLKKFIKKHAPHRRLLLDGDETFPLARAEKARVRKIFRQWALTMSNPEFFEPLDICGASSGVGALSHRRYRVLVAGRKVPHLIDMKEAVPSSASAFSRFTQPKWVNEAQRIAEVQRMIQYAPIARLGWSRTRGNAYVFSEYQPAEDRVNSMDLSDKEYADFADQWGRLLAWSHLRGGGWRGAATTSEYIRFAARFNQAGQRRLLAQAHATADEIRVLFAKFQRLA